MVAPLPQSTLTAFADGVWLDSGAVSMLGMQLTSAMTVLRLGDGNLLVHSPVALTPERRSAVQALGSVAHLYAPNTFHHLHLGDWAQAFPEARVHAPAALAKKRPDLRIDRAHGAAPEAAFAGCVEEHEIAGFRLEESALYHRSSRSLVVADLVHNIGRPEHGWTKFYARTMGFYDRVALSKMLRWTAIGDKAALRRSVDALLALDFERLIVGHGAPLVSGAKEALRAAFSWL